MMSYYETVLNLAIMVTLSAHWLTLIICNWIFLLNTKATLLPFKILNLILYVPATLQQNVQICPPTTSQL